ncbi:MAG: ketopantoate reductase family protein [Spirochaetaceae bacterium]
MQEIRRIAVIGAGAIGAVYGSLLHAAYPGRVRFVADAPRAKRLEASGVRVNGVPHAVPAAAPETLEVQPDLVLVAVKYHHLPRVVELIDRIRHEDTVVVSLLNGIDSEEIIAGRIGWDHVLYGMALAIDAVRTGNEITVSSNGTIYLGRAENAEVDGEVAAVRDVLAGAGISVEVPGDMLRMLWWKFMINIGMNQVSAVLGAPYREFQENEHARALTDRAMYECVAVAAAEGIDLGEADIARWHEVLKRLAPEGKTSMLQDIEAGRKTEVEMLAGQLIERAARHGIDVPCNEALLHMIKVYEARSGAVS